jgi:dephospho-CoA kinase
VSEGRVDREALRRAVLGRPDAMKRLEAIVWPLVRDEERRFLVVSAPAAVQRVRVLRRPGMTEERLAAIRGRQMPDAEKRRHADAVVLTGLSRHFAQASLRRLLAQIVP